MSLLSWSDDYSTLESLDKKLAGFTIDTDDDEVFISTLRKWYQLFLFKKKCKSELVKIQIIENELMEALTILKGGGFKSQSIELDDSSVEDFLEDYIENTYRSLTSYFGPTMKLIGGDLSYVVTPLDRSSEKAVKKIINGFMSYGYSLDKLSECKDYQSAIIECSKDLLVLFDMTTFGSGKSGIILTKNYLAFESIYTSREFIYINDIENISLNTSERELTVNNKKMKFIDSEIIYPLKKTIECINQYLQQPSIKLKEHLVRTKLYG